MSIVAALATLAGAAVLTVAAIIAVESLLDRHRRRALDKAAADAEALSVCTDPECLLHTDAGASLADVLLWPDGEPLP